MNIWDWYNAIKYFDGSPTVNEDVAKILKGLAELKVKAEAGELEFSVANEDIHLNLEKMRCIFERLMLSAEKRIQTHFYIPQHFYELHTK